VTLATAVSRLAVAVFALVAQLQTVPYAVLIIYAHNVNLFTGYQQTKQFATIVTFLNVSVALQIVFAAAALKDTRPITTE
jgi:hypothetical protein